MPVRFTDKVIYCSVCKQQLPDASAKVPFASTGTSQSQSVPVTAVETSAAETAPLSKAISANATEASPILVTSVESLPSSQPLKIRLKKNSNVSGRTTRASVSGSPEDESLGLPVKPAGEASKTRRGRGSWIPPNVVSVQ